MAILDENMIKQLSFPDSSVEKTEFYPEKKELKIFVDGAWLDIGKGKQIGKGKLCINNWHSLSITRFDPITEKMSTIVKPEKLKDICEASFTDSEIQLSGFGKTTGQWVQWTIHGGKITAEFDMY